MIRPRLATVGAALVLAATTAAACSRSGSGGGSEDAASGSGSRSDRSSTPATTAAPLPEGYAGYHSDTYADPANWLCRPDKADDVCTGEDLDATVVNADGSTEIQAHEVADDPPVDCFYVYPTTSGDEGLSADMVPGEFEEIATTRNQAARFTSSCRVFAPMYRQVTLNAIGGRAQGDYATASRQAYQDVLDAFKQYLANDSDGRGFVLIGHSQGSFILGRLIANEIDAQPALRDRLVSAILPGGNLSVPRGEAVGGTFQNIPLCEADDQTGCLVAYSSFRASAPPPAGSLFARNRSAGEEDACVNPAALGGGKGTLEPYFAVALRGGGRGSPFVDPTRTAELHTRWFTEPDFVEAECVHDGDATYLALTVAADPADPRGDDIGGDLTPEWGMHLIDVNVALGNLVDLVASQADAYAAG
jgi:hypothetical protein